MLLMHDKFYRIPINICIIDNFLKFPLIIYMGL